VFTLNHQNVSLLFMAVFSSFPAEFDIWTCPPFHLELSIVVVKGFIIKTINLSMQQSCQAEKGWVYIGG
jgi:hypothetical protein